MVKRIMTSKKLKLGVKMEKKFEYKPLFSNKKIVKKQFKYYLSAFYVSKASY